MEQVMGSVEEEEVGEEKDNQDYRMHLIMGLYVLFVIVLILVNRWLNRSEKRRMQVYRDLKELEDFGAIPEQRYLRKKDLKFVTHS